jgi:hypothetical protein
MGVAQSSSAVRVISQSWVDGAWGDYHLGEYTTATTVGDVAIAANAFSNVVLGPGDILTAFVRGGEDSSAATKIEGPLGNMGERLANLTIHMSDTTYPTMYLRFGVTNYCAGACPVGTTTNVAFVTDNLDGTHTFTFTDMSTAVVTDVPGTGGGATGAPGADGNSITSIVDNGDGTITIHVTGLAPITTSDFTGPQGLPGTPGTPGAAGAAGAAGAPGAAGVSIVDASYNNITDEFTILYSDNTTDTFTGFTGEAGVNGTSVQISQINYNTLDTTIIFTDGSIVVIPNGAIGATGATGATGNGVDSIIDNYDGSVTITLTNGTTTNWDISLAFTTAIGNVLLDQIILYDNNDGTYTGVFGYESLNTIPLYREPSNISPLNRVTGNGVLLGGTPSWFTPGHNEGFEVEWDGIGTLMWEFDHPNLAIQSVSVTTASALQRPGAVVEPTGSITLHVTAIYAETDGSYTAEFGTDSSNIEPFYLTPSHPTNPVNAILDNSVVVSTVPPSWIVPGIQESVVSHNWDGVIPLVYTIQDPTLATRTAVADAINATVRPGGNAIIVASGRVNHNVDINAINFIAGTGTSADGGTLSSIFSSVGAQVFVFTFNTPQPDNNYKVLLDITEIKYGPALGSANEAVYDGGSVKFVEHGGNVRDNTKFVFRLDTPGHPTSTTSITIDMVVLRPL